MNKNLLGKGISGYDELRQVQMVELEILLDFARICEKHNLEYFLEGGTLLGAVRHKGFIPWDDDIDVSMERKDFEHFLEIAPQELGDKYFVQYKTTDKYAPLTFIKLRKNETAFVEWNKRNIKMHHGIFIDIFPYDKLPQHNRAAYKKECRKLNKQFIIKYIPDRTMQPQLSLKWILGAIYRRGLYYLYKLIPNKAFDKKVLAAFRRHENDEYENIVYTCHPSNVIKGFLNEYKKEDVFPTRELEFEGHLFKVPNNYVSYLTQLYGDYMELPPEDKRYGHRPAYISFTENYKKGRN